VTRNYHAVDTFSAGSTGDLITINGGVDGARLVMTAYDNTHTIVCKDGTGNMEMAGDFSLTHSSDTIEFIYNGQTSKWVELSRSDNSA